MLRFHFDSYITSQLTISTMHARLSSFQG
jgi:hypothetical protein